MQTKQNSDKRKPSERPAIQAQEKDQMKVFVTGVNGYVGAVLAPYLIERGLSVLALDTGYYRDGWLYSDNRHFACSPQTLNKDLRHITEQDLEGCDAVAHLAELSNDPLGQNKPEVTHRINHKGSVTLAEKARAVGIRRFVYTSSCSVYGAGTGDFLDESCATNPQTTYAECKVACRTGRRQDGRAGFLPGLPAQCDGVWSLAAHAFRHRVERPFRAGLDDEADCDGKRRQPVATARARRGHVRGHLSVPCRAGGCGAGQGFQRRPELRELSDPRNRPDRGRGVPGVRGDRRSRAGATIAAIASTSTASIANCRGSRAATRPETVQGNCAKCSSAYR